MKKSLLLAVLMVCFLAIPAFASVQNVKVSGDVDSTWLMRNDFDLGTNTIGDRNQNVFLTQTRLQVQGELTDNVSAVVALINERAWDADNDSGTNNTDVDLNLAYVTLKEMLYSPLTVHIGRQNNIRYGNGFVVDSQGTNNVATGALATIAQDLTKRTALDAIRAVLDYHPLTLELLFAKVDANTLTGAPDKRDDVDLWGANANYQLGDKMNTEVEGYFFAKIDKSVQVSGTGAGNKSDTADTVYVPGLRASTNPIEGLNVQAEVAWQRGNKVFTTSAAGNNQRREAMGAEAIASYKVPFEATKQWKPVVTGVYSYTSGDKSTTSDLAAPTEKSREEYRAWDPMFENQGGGTIYNTLFDLSNSHIYIASAQVSPIEDVIAKVTWTGLWSDKEDRESTLTIRQPDGGTTTAQITTNQQVGYEIDAELVYDYTEDVQFGLLMGWFNPGDTFTSRTGTNGPADSKHTASQVIAHTDVKF